MSEKTYYIDAARYLLDQPESTFREMGRRYLSLARRSALLAQPVVLSGNPLADIKFKGPLSVANQPSSVIVRAERLQMDGIPIAFELDARGAHRGAQIGETMEALARELDRPVDESEVLEWYGELMRHNFKRAKRVAKVRTEMRALRKKIDAAMSVATGMRFAMIVDAQLLVSGLDRAVKVRPGDNLVLGFDGKVVRLNGTTGIACQAIYGRGGAVVSASDLRLVYKHGVRVGDGVMLMFNAAKWEANIVRDGQYGPTMDFEYYGVRQNA